jgi:hypothetical protein
MCRRVCAVGVVALAFAVITPVSGAVWLSKTTARSVAFTLASQTCRSFDWCVNFEVATARGCHRARDVVYCGIAFVTVDRVRCGGVVAVKKVAGGRIDRGMAVPVDCGAAAASSDPGSA